MYIQYSHFIPVEANEMRSKNTNKNVLLIFMTWHVFIVFLLTQIYQLR